MRLPATRDPVLVKKYGNRRLYDTEASRYVTLEELEARVRGGDDVRVLDARTHEDLTQATLTQIILEGRGAARLLPVPLLLQLIRMGDDALAEFLGRYLSGALELYVQARSSAQSLAPWVPMATLPFQATSALARMFLGAGQLVAPDPSWTPRPGDLAAGREGTVPPPDATAPRGAPEGAATEGEVAALRRELDALKAAVERAPSAARPAPKEAPKRAVRRERTRGGTAP